MTHLPRLTAALLALLLTLPFGAHAEHEADHRYTIRGYVVDADERPLAGVRVTATLAGQGSSGAQTDDDGFYQINLHLHDADIGRELVLRAGDVRASIRMQAERGDQHTERVHWASFVGSEFREDALGRFHMPGWGWVLIGVGGLVALLAGGLRVQRVLKRRRRAATEEPRPAGAPARRAARSRKRKSRRR